MLSSSLSQIQWMGSLYQDSGLRNARVPVLLPGSEEKLIWNIECGYVKVPRIKVIDGRKAISSSQDTNEPGANTEGFAGDVIKVIDLRRDRMRQDESQIEGGDSFNNQSSADEQERLATILVLS
jgi:trafficking protein particle complex subunit 11